MNPLDLIKMIKNPQEYVMKMAKQNNNPMLNNLINMANNNDIKGLETFAKNLMEQQGRDFNKEMEQLQSYFGK